ncbi:MAG: hypothetical protein KAS86_05040, partial [Candidatus Omnitrophica bacterium]|nr:hypothetical protein [Candidatus Omnitrophota bacterium]
ELKRFAQSFTEGMELISAGDLRGAKGKLLEASGSWPEYFGTDFVLALVCEDSGDIKTAARFYKTYLNKLRDLYAGQYRISGPMIRVLTLGDIEEYDAARELVRKRLYDRGISLDKVRPAARFPAFFFYIGMLAAFIAFYFTITYRVMPYMKKQRRIKNPPEGFWVCTYCGAESPELSKVCNECGRPRD